MAIGAVLTVTAASCLQAQQPGTTPDPPLMPQEAAALNGSTQMTAAPAASTTACWSAWKQEQHLHEGTTPRPDGGNRYLGSAESEVRLAPGDRGWLSARDAAFT